MFESPSAKKFLQALHPAYKPPSRKTISGPLLDKIYEMTKVRTEELIFNLPNINIVTDESNSITGARICNISVHTPSGTIHYISEDIQAKQMNDVAAAQWLRSHLLVLTNDDLSRINSIVTDTCKTMFAMWTEMQTFIDFKHVLFIPCDSHGLQLLVKDLLKIPTFKTIIDKAQAVVRAFRSSLLQYARLRQFQLQYYKQHRSLVLSVITRWGTHYRLIRSLLDSKDALKRYAHEYGDLPATKRLKTEVINILKDREFWSSLESLREVLQPLDEALKMSESGNSHLGHVLPRWMAIAEHLKMRRMDYYDELDPFMSIDGDDSNSFSHRYKRQILPIHIAAYYLTPENRTKPTPEHFESQLLSFFRKSTSSTADYETLCYEFESFRAQSAPFEYGRRCWTLSKTPRLFWHSAMSQSTIIGKLAYRLFSTPCNSVASERAFSIQNLIHTKSRNRLKSATTDKLTYIYTNGRMLDQFEGLFQPSSLPSIKAKSFHDLTLEDELALENDLLGIDLEDESIEKDNNENLGENNDEETCSEDEDEDENDQD